MAPQPPRSLWIDENTFLAMLDTLADKRRKLMVLSFIMGMMFMAICDVIVELIKHA